MTDKIATVPRQKVAQIIGRVDKETMDRIGAQVALLLGLV